MGGPFMGRRTSLDAPIVKTTGGIIAQKRSCQGLKKSAFSSVLRRR